MSFPDMKNCRLEVITTDTLLCVLDCAVRTFWQQTRSSKTRMTICFSGFMLCCQTVDPNWVINLDHGVTIMKWLPNSAAWLRQSNFLIRQLSVDLCLYYFVSSLPLLVTPPRLSTHRCYMLCSVVRSETLSVSVCSIRKEHRNCWRHQCVLSMDLHCSTAGYYDPSHNFPLNSPAEHPQQALIRLMQHQRTTSQQVICLSDCVSVCATSATTVGRAWRIPENKDCRLPSCGADDIAVWLWDVDALPTINPQIGPVLSPLSATDSL